MSLYNRIIEFQNRTEQNFQRRKSIGNLLLYLLAFATFLLSNLVAIVRWPIALVTKKPAGTELQKGVVNSIAENSFKEAISLPGPTLIKFGTEW